MFELSPRPISPPYSNICSCDVSNKATRRKGLDKVFRGGKVQIVSPIIYRKEGENMKLTKDEKYKVEDILGQIYGGVAIALDPFSDDYKKITNRLGEDLKELRTLLDLN